jgi:hypothetical protein
MNNVIYTLDARENFFLECMTVGLNLDDSTVYDEINIAFEDCVSELKQLGVKYNDLKNGLIPHTDRNEIAFVFDSRKVESSMYGFSIMQRIIPLFDKSSCSSVLCGDFIGIDSFKIELKFMFLESIIDPREIDYTFHDHFYLVYVNNLSEQSFNILKNGLRDYLPYVGYFDLNYSSILKTYLSTILVRHFIKAKSVIIMADEFSGNFNVYGYPFEEHGFQCKAITDIYYGLFLSYKIEREVFDGFIDDTKFSINAITKNVFDIRDFSLVIEEPKLQYLLEKKKENILRAGLDTLTLSELEALIKLKIANNYIYNLCFMEEFLTIKFNIIIEVPRKDATKPLKMIVALNYIPADKILKLVTMF